MQFQREGIHSHAPDLTYDLVCVGFGPAGLAIAASLHDAILSGAFNDRSIPRVLFLEKQNSFAWHAGMLLPGTKMQISFVKDLATMRNPSSPFTFLNYLHKQGRLADFTNLDTFLPSREEYSNYMKWCASFFDDVVKYGQETIAVSPGNKDGAVDSFIIKSRHVQSGRTNSYRGKNIVIAAGGQPLMPSLTPKPHARLIHSSQYADRAPKILSDSAAPCRIAVLGAGQSAAEIFFDLQKRYKNAEVWLVMRQEFLRPSDDSPFINSIFNPEYTDCVFNRSPQHRNTHIVNAQATNYSVVRSTLLEALYEHMYHQKRELGPDERLWPHRILGNSQIVNTIPRGDGGLTLRIQVPNSAHASGFEGVDFKADLVVAATGYQRKAHIEMMRDTWDLLPLKNPLDDGGVKEGIAGWNVSSGEGERKLAVGRDYKVKFQEGTVADNSGIWLQGCCEGTHGLSDTLLSVLATRSGELVGSIFGNNLDSRGEMEFQFKSRL